MVGVERENGISLLDILSAYEIFEHDISKTFAFLSTNFDSLLWLETE